MITDKFFQTLGNLGADGSNFAAAYSGNTPEAIQDPTGAGYGLVGRYILNVGDHRCESDGSVDRDPTFGVDYWTRWMVYIPADWTQAPEKLTFMQIHEEPDDTPADYVGQAQIIGGIRGDRIFVRNNFYEGETTPNLSSITSRLLIDLPLAPYLGAWLEIAMRAKWSYSQDGLLEFYFNGVPMFRESGRSNAFNNAVARGGNDAYHKLGLYDDEGNTTANNYVLHRGIQRGAGYATYDEFAAACGSGNTQYVPPGLIF